MTQETPTHWALFLSCDVFLIYFYRNSLFSSEILWAISFE